MNTIDSMQEEAEAILNNASSDPVARMLAHISLRLAAISATQMTLTDGHLEHSHKLVKHEQKFQEHAEDIAVLKRKVGTQGDPDFRM